MTDEAFRIAIIILLGAILVMLMAIGEMLPYLRGRTIVIEEKKEPKYTGPRIYDPLT